MNTRAALPTIMEVKTACFSTTENPSNDFRKRVPADKMMKLSRKKDSSSFVHKFLYTLPTITQNPSKVATTTVIAQRLIRGSPSAFPPNMANRTICTKRSSQSNI